MDVRLPVCLFLFLFPVGGQARSSERNGKKKRGKADKDLDSLRVYRHLREATRRRGKGGKKLPFRLFGLSNRKGGRKPPDPAGQEKERGGGACLGFSDANKSIRPKEERKTDGSCSILYGLTKARKKRGEEESLV